MTNAMNESGTDVDIDTKIKKLKMYQLDMQVGRT